MSGEDSAQGPEYDSTLGPDLMSDRCLCPGTPGEKDLGKRSVGSSPSPRLPRMVCVLSMLGRSGGSLARTQDKAAGCFPAPFQ